MKILKNAVLLDVAHEYERADVLVDGERIAAVGQELRADGAEVIDLGGMTLMPAFIDAHVHMKAFDAFEEEEPVLKALVYNGVSAVKDMGILGSEPLEGYIEWLRRQDEPGKVRIATAGRYIDVEGGYGMGPLPGMDWGIKITTAEEAAAAVRYQFRGGVDGIKIGISDGSMGPVRGKLSPEQVRAVTATARELGIWSTAHVLKASDLRMLVVNGIGEAGHTPDDELIDDETIAAMVARHIPMTTTIGNVTADSPLPHCPPDMAPEEFRAQKLAKKAMILRNIKKFYEAGGTVNVGTDLMRITDPMREATIPVNELMLLRRDAGMPMHEVIRAGTVNAAASCGFRDEGAIRPGNRANLIAFDGELDDDFAQLLALQFVMNRGVLIRG